MHTDPFSLADALVDALATISPSGATFWGVKGHDHRWDDLSPDGAVHATSELRAWRARVAALPPATDRFGRLATHVLADLLDSGLDGYDQGDDRRNLNHLASPFQHLVRTFDAMDTSGPEGWDNVICRLEGLEGALGGYRKTLQLGLDRGEAVAARQVRSVVGQGRVHAGETGLFASLGPRCGSQGDPATAARVGAASERARQAYGAFTDWLERDYLPRATPVDGVGRERYRRAARSFLGSDVDLDDTYAWGWEELRRLQGRMEAAAADLSPGVPVRDVVHALMTDPRHCAPDADAFLAAMTERQARALAAVDGVHFEVPPGVRTLDVRRAPPGGPPGAYYVPPSEDLSRPGAVWYSLGDGPYALWDEVSTAYHEGFPGHHLQLGIQVTLRDRLCRAHRIAYGYSGFAEGWALYAEELMGELGQYERPEYVLGMLANQTMRACRVVFDIGAHLDLPIPADAPFAPGERWTYDRGVAFVREVGGMTEETAHSEITRYLGWPGQAISYKVGQRAMLGLRAEFLAGGGTLRAFHDRVLSCGNVGLDILRSQVLGSG